MKKKSAWSAAKYLVYFVQLGVNLIIPPVALTFLAVFLKNRFGWGNGVVIAGILLGIGTAGLTCTSPAVHAEESR